MIVPKFPMDACGGDEMIKFMLLITSDICDEVHIVRALGEPLFDNLVEDTAAFMICVIEGSFCPTEEGFVLFIEHVQFIRGTW